MRHIPLKTTTDMVDYQAFLLQIMTFAGANKAQTGFSLDQVAQCVRLRKAIKPLSTGDTLVLDEDDWKFICELFNSTHFAQALEGLIEMRDDLNNAERHLPGPQTKTAPVKARKLG